MARIKKADAPALTQERLYQLICYDPETGQIWRISNTKFKLCTPEHDNLGYQAIQIDSVRYRVHRLAWFYVYGTWPVTLDHVNGIRNDNRFANLREATVAQNCRNTKQPVSNTSGFKGVIRFRKGWRAGIKTGGKFYYIGYFRTPEAAHEAYCKAAKNLFGEFWNPG